jgi:hypothetical protein
MAVCTGKKDSTEERICRQNSTDLPPLNSGGDPGSEGTEENSRTHEKEKAKVWIRN